MPRMPDENPLLKDMATLTVERIADALRMSMSLLDRPQDKLGLSILIAHQILEMTVEAAYRACPHFGELNEIERTAIVLGLLGRSMHPGKLPPAHLTEARIREATDSLVNTILASGRPTA